MKRYESGQIRNVALVGHSSCGKTLLTKPCCLRLVLRADGENRGRCRI